MIKSKIRLPDEYRIYDGMILPESYVDFRKVENLFKRPLDLFAMLRVWNLEQKEVFMTTGVDKEFYDDSTLAQKLKEDFGIDDLRKLDIRDRKMKVPVLRNKYGSSIKQICRFTNFDVILVRKLCPW